MKTADAIALVAGVASAGAGVIFTAYYIAQKGGGGTYDVSVGVAASSGTPIAGAVVSLGSATQVTDNLGEVLFAGIAAGSYSLSVVALGYNSVSEPVAVSSTAYSFQVTLSAVGSCTPQPCPCGEAWNSIDCKCVPQQVASIVAPATLPFKQTWVVTWLNIPSLVCGMAYPGTSCPSGAPQCDSACNCQYPDTVQVPITVTVKDVNGAPVCGVPVTAGLTNTQIPIPFAGTNLSNLSGTFQIALDLAGGAAATVKTDSQGMATFQAAVTLVGLGNSEICYDPLGCQGNSAFSIPFSMFFSAPGAPDAASSLVMQALICAFGSF